ncbi:DUF4843 domain-containing protein [Chitinophagaceae bacterium 26-R-25]|nr:DUF4843 domain-containing protein [Chitinophagaceae bacterium 26-R-25]
MQSKLNILFLLFAAGILAGSCSKDDRLMYEQDPRIYFDSYANISDSINYSFGIQPLTVTTDTVYMIMRIMGNAEQRDREFKLVLADTSTAKWGYHFSTGPLIVPAGAYQARIPVYLYKQPGMKDTIITADFNVAESKDFKPGYDDKLRLTGNRTRVQFKIAIDDQVLKPANWASTLQPKFGDFSVVKFKFMIKATGKINWNGPIYPGEMSFLVQQVHLALYEYEQQNGPLYDENKNRVVLP